MTEHPILFSAPMVLAILIKGCGTGSTAATHGATIRGAGVFHSSASVDEASMGSNRSDSPLLGGYAPKRRLQLAADFPLVCNLFGFDAEYRRLIWNWLERNDRAAKCYRQIAYSLRRTE